MTKKETVKLDGRAAAIAFLEGKYGKNTVIEMGSQEIEPMAAIKTGCLGLDLALGIGGIPQGRIVEIYGPESSGKTTLSLHIAAECQKAGGRVGFVDAEHALDPYYARKLGVEVDKIDICQPASGEEGLDVAYQLAKSGAYRLLIVDSVAALTPKKELEGEIEDANVGLQARMMAKAMRLLTGAANENNCTIIFINQIRMKIGVMFGNPETTSGGRALPFHASVRIEVRKQESNTKKAGEEIIANGITFKVVKNKCAPPFKKAETFVYYGKGIWRPAALLALAVEMGIVNKGGAWYSYGDVKHQGTGSFETWLESNPNIMDELENKIISVTRTGEIPE